MRRGELAWEKKDVSLRFALPALETNAIKWEHIDICIIIITLKGKGKLLIEEINLFVDYLDN